MKFQECIENGLKKELEFAELLIQSYGGCISKSTTSVDINKHIDLWWEYKGRTIGLDIKAMKKHSRKDHFADDSIHWVELKNVNGKPGWVFGEANYIVFETVNSWILVKRIVLLSFLKTIVDFSTIHNDSSELYTLYRRKGRKDLIVKIPTKDLVKISSRIIDKTVEIEHEKTEYSSSCT